MREYESEQNLNTEVSLLLISPWVCYLVADGLEMSGIVAIMINGIFLNQYATPNISSLAKQVVKSAVDTMAYTAETVVFLFLGVGLVTYQEKFQEVDFGTIACSMVNLNIARFLNIWITSWISNKYRSDESKIDFKKQFVMWIAGLRGAMAYALSMESSHNKIFNNPATGKISGDVMLVITLLYSMFTILGISTFLHPIMNKCGVTKKKEEVEPERTETEKELIEQVRKSKEDGCCMRFKHRMSMFDMYYFSPLFVNRAELVEYQNEQTVKALKESIVNAKR